MKRRQKRIVVSLLVVLALFGVYVAANGGKLGKVTLYAIIPSGTYFSNVVVIVMENEPLTAITSTTAPYMTNLASTYSSSTNYREASDGSLPNYMALATGNTYSSWSTCNNAPASCVGLPSGGQAGATLMDELTAAGFTWKSYMENMPSNCYGSYVNAYAPNHNPFIYLASINPSQCSLNVPAGVSANTDTNLLADLNSASAPNMMWLTPNNSNNMDTTTVAYGDSYLSTIVPQILQSTTFTSKKAALFITFDESFNGLTAPMYAAWAGPAVKRAYSSAAVYNHYSFPKTLETNWGISSSLLYGGSGSSMSEFFSSFVNTLGVSMTALPTSAVSGSTITFSAAINGGTSPYTVSWSFGDGVTQTTTSTTTSASTTHIYTVSSSQSFTPSISVKDSNTVQQTATANGPTIRISAPTPTLVISASATPQSAPVGQTVTFSGTASGGTSPYTFTWQFGDTMLAQGQSVTHAYASAGSYTVVLSVSDSSATTQIGQATLTETVTAAASFSVTFGWTPIIPQTGVSVTFTPAVSGGVIPYSYSWAFGDGASTNSNTAAQHVYSSPGTFNVTVTVSDASSRTATVQYSITVTPGGGSGSNFFTAFLSFMSNTYVLAGIMSIVIVSGGALYYRYEKKPSRRVPFFSK